MTRNNFHEVYIYNYDPYLINLSCFRESDGTLRGTNVKFFNIIAEKLKLKPTYHVMPQGTIDRKTGRLKGGLTSHVRQALL